MQSEAFRYKKSFEHRPKPSKHPNDKVFISGISMENSRHFYKLIGKEKKVMTRHKIDNLVESSEKKNLYSETTSKNTQCWIILFC